MARDLLLGNTNRNWSRDWSCGSMLLPASQEKRLFNKIDDVRYDMRRVGNKVAMGVFALSAAFGLLALSSIYRTSQSCDPRRGTQP
jgi:hypothetical protein